MAISDSWLTQQLAKRTLSITKFANLLWVLDARGVAYLPSLDWLVVSDLHLEKGSYLRSYGNPLPSLDSQATLKRLEHIIHDYQPERVISLGDSFHDKYSMSRMTPSDRERLSELVLQVNEWSWVEGNHDPNLPDGIPGDACEEIHLHQQGLYDVVFRHEPKVLAIENGDEELSRAQIIGHFHPKMRTSISRRRYSGKCFVATQALFIMPAFGQFTGGLDIDDEVMLALLDKNERKAFMMYDGIIFGT